MVVRSDQQPEPSLTRRRRLLVLGICSMSLLIVGLDTTIVNVALPAIHRSFHASLSGLQWTIDAYTLVMARVLQAIGGSMLNPVAMSIIRNVFEDPGERAKAIGVWGGVIGISMALGPLVGGALIDSVGWPAVFLLNVPVGLLAIGLTAAFVPESRAPHPRRIDPLGQVLVVVALAALTYAIIQGPTSGWLSAQILGLFGLAVAAFAILIAYELRREQPLLEVRFFASAPFSGASSIAVCAFAAMGGFLFLNTLYLQNVRGFSPFHAGLYTLPMAGITLVIAPLSGQL